ncbi:uncharacterized protein LOC134105232 [Pungitius pungitius]|uniref:uncharacterized protein LOC134105232 n=1 Tax=Pungitius pungitius TaxID=134920 RepID=UPI002E0F1E5E
MVWQWEGDEGQWEPYPPALCALLDSAVSSGDASVSLPVGSGTSYEVDLKKMVQINPVTKYKRKIRSQTVKPESLDDAGELAAPNSSAPLKEEETEKQPAAKRKRAQSKSQTKSEKTPKEEIKSDEVVRTVIMKGKAPVDPECKAKLGKAHVYCEGNDVYDVMLNQAIVVTFGIFWLPYHVINMMQVAAQWYKEDSPKRHRLDHITQSSRAVTSALAFISSCANPILYTRAIQLQIQLGQIFKSRKVSWASHFSVSLLNLVSLHSKRCIENKRAN